MGSYCQDCRGSHLFTPYQSRDFLLSLPSLQQKRRCQGCSGPDCPGQPEHCRATAGNTDLLLPPPQITDFPTHTGTRPPTASRNVLNFPKYERQLFPHLVPRGDPFPRGFTCHREGSQDTCPSLLLSLEGWRVWRSHLKKLTCGSEHSRWSKGYCSIKQWLEDQERQEEGAGKVQIEGGIFWEVRNNNALSREFFKHHWLISKEVYAACPLVW